MINIIFEEKKTKNKQEIYEPMFIVIPTAFNQQIQKINKVHGKQEVVNFF